MTFLDTFLNGEKGLFKPSSLTPMQKLILRFVVCWTGFLWICRN